MEDRAKYNFLPNGDRSRNIQLFLFLMLKNYEIVVAP